MNSSISEMNGKGQVSVWLILLLFVSAQATIFFALDNKYERRKGDFEVKIGSYQAGVYDAVQRGEEMGLFVEQAAKLSAIKAREDFGASGGEYNPVAGGGGTRVVQNVECGSYIYNKWSNKTEFCKDSGGSAYETYFGKNFKAYLNKYSEGAGLNYNVTSSGDGNVINIAGLPLEPSEIIVRLGEVERLRPVPDFSAELAAPTDSVRVSSCYGNRLVEKESGEGERTDFHDGIDYAVGLGKDIRAVQSGRVYRTCSGFCGGYGNNVIINHSGLFYTRYSHLSELRVSEGEAVSSGEIVGLSGDSGRSTGPHLDFKIYDTARNGFEADTAKNPFCLYPEEYLDQLSINEPYTEEESCVAKYGSPPKFTKTIDQIKRECGNLDIEGLNEALGESTQSASQNEVTGAYQWEVEMLHELAQGRKGSVIGKYTPPTSFAFRINSSIDPSGREGYYSSVISWAEETWQECRDDPVTCFKSSVEEQNDKEDKSFELASQNRCEQTPVFNAIKEEFAACLNNGKSNCVCELDLRKVFDTEEYDIRFEGNRIRMVKPEEDTFYPGEATTFASVVPAEGTEEDWIKLTQETDAEGNRHFTLDWRRGTEDYPVIKWYKPEKDKMVMVQKQGDKPLCQNNRDTFLVCAQPEGSDEKMKFALQLRDRKPSKPKQVEMTQVDGCSEGWADKVSDVIASSFATPLGGLAVSTVQSVIMNTVSGPCKAANNVIIEQEENADISGYEVYCSLSTPVGDVGVEQAQGMVLVDNARTSNLSEGLQSRANSLKVDVEKMLEGVNAGNLPDDVCDYAKMSGEDGRQRIVRAYDSIRDGNKVSFNLNACQGEAMKQLLDGVAEYCYKLVPVDSSGQRGEPVKKCMQLTSVMQRVMEELGLESIASPYLKVVEDAQTAADAIQNGDYGKIMQMAGNPQSEMLQDFQGGDAMKWFQKNIGKDAILEVGDDISSGEFDSAVGQALERMPQPEKAGMAVDLLETGSLSPEAERTVIREVGNNLPDAEVQEWTGDVIRNHDDLGGFARQRSREFFIQEAESLGEDEFEEALNEVRREDPELADDIERTARENREALSDEAENEISGMAVAEFQEVVPEDLNDLGLTEEQTRRFVMDALEGRYGDAAEEAAMEYVNGKMPADGRREYISEMAGVARQDQGVREVMMQHVVSADDSIRAQAMDDLPRTGLDEETRDAIIDSLDAESTQELFTIMRGRYGSKVEEEVKGEIDGIFNPPACAPHPLENYS